MKPGGAFHRSRAMFAAIVAAVALEGVANQRAALDKVGTYRSRGKGLGLLGNKHSDRTVAQDKRDAVKARNKRRG